MATAKKATEEKVVKEPVKAVAKVDVKAPAAVEAKAETVEKKAEVEPKKEPVKAEAKAAVKKAPAKKAAAPKKAAAKKETAPKAAAPKKAVVKESVCLQFSDKSYTTEDLVKIAKDVWVYDLNRKIDDFKSVDLYVKPEEGLTYYVINGEVTGNFLI